MTRIPADMELLGPDTDAIPPAQRWCIITCEYPPLAGGVSDHTYHLARALAEAGDTEVWTPPIETEAPALPGVTVHVLPSLFGLDALRILHKALREQPRGTRILVQYVPTGYGWRMMNLPFALLLFSQRRRGLDVYFHEVGFPIGRRERWRRNAAGLVHVAMTWLTVRSAARVFVAIPEWRKRLVGLGSRSAFRRSVTWVPVPSNVPDVARPERVRAIRATLLTGSARWLVGHFGTFGRWHQTVLPRTFIHILDDGADRVVLLVGRNSSEMRDVVVAMRPDLGSRVVATGGVSSSEVSEHLAACDVLVQPFDDGVSSRRTSLMAGLALGMPVITNRGSATGKVWLQHEAVALTESAQPEVLARRAGVLLADPELRRQLGIAGKELHSSVFAMERGVRRLRGAIAYAPAGDPAPTAPRVLMLHTTLPGAGRKLGGVEVAVHRLANALVDRGVPVTVASLDDAPSDARYAHRRLFASAPWLRDSRLGRLVVLPVLLNLVSFRGADVVHFHGDDWFVLRRPHATVRTLHGSALREAQRSTRWQRQLVQYLVYPLERLAARMATITVAVGRDAAALHGIHRVIGNGVDPELFTPGSKSPTPTLLYVGTWEGRKRGRWLYELFTQSIAPRNPAVELRFISDEEPPAHPQVRFERFPDDVTLARAYREAWVFVLPSTYEGFGIPYLEAMASGTAVLASPNTGARDLLGDGKYGSLVRDPEFADAVLDLLGDSGRRAALAEAGLGRSHDYLWPDVASAYVDVYKQAIDERTGITRSA